MFSTKAKVIYILVLIAVASVGLVTFNSVNKHQEQAESSNSLSTQLGGDFSVPTADGLFNLIDYRGKVVLLYFGFASCPDVCPTALAMIGNALKTMPKSATDSIQPLFISVDPTRDDLEKLKTYGHYFHPSFLAGTTEKANIDILVKQYGAFYSFHKLEDSAMEYSVDHSSRVYIIDKEGQLTDLISHADILKDLPTQLLSLTN